MKLLEVGNKVRLTKEVRVKGEWMRDALSGDLCIAPGTVATVVVAQKWKNPWDHRDGEIDHNVQGLVVEIPIVAGISVKFGCTGHSGMEQV